MDKLDNVINKYNNTCHSAIKVEPVDIKSSKYINSGKEINNKDPIFKIGDNVQNIKISKYFCKRLRPKLVQKNCF